MNNPTLQPDIDVTARDIVLKGAHRISIAFYGDGFSSLPTLGYHQSWVVQ